ncbi:hypothetical protein Tco_1171588 [Tanacetum coccineum]
MGCDENRISINVVAAIFVAVSILQALKTEDLSRKLEVNYVKFQFRGGLLGVLENNEIGSDPGLDSSVGKFSKALKSSSVQRTKDMIIGKSHSQDLSEVLQSEFRRKCEAAEKAYDLKKKKDLNLMQCKQLEFLTLKTDNMPEGQTAFVSQKKEAKSNSNTTSISARSHSQDLLEVLQSEFRRKREAAKKAYDVKKQKDLNLMQCKELKFLTLKTDSMPEGQTTLVSQKKDEIMWKYV